MDGNRPSPGGAITSTVPLGVCMLHIIPTRCLLLPAILAGEKTHAQNLRATCRLVVVDLLKL